MANKLDSLEEAKIATNLAGAVINAAHIHFGMGNVNCCNDNDKEGKEAYVASADCVQNDNGIYLF